MATEQLTMQQSWDGVQGKLIEDFIKKELQSKISAKEGIKDFKFEKDQYQSDKVNYTITYADGSTKTDSFALSVPSKEVIYLSNFYAEVNDLGKNTCFVSPGNPLKVYYSFYVKNDDGNVAGRYPEAIFTIKNGSSVETYKVNPGKPSYANGHRTISLEIPAQYIKEGVNEITINLSYSRENQITNMEIDNGSAEFNQFINIASFTPVLETSLQYNNDEAYTNLLPGNTPSLELKYDCKLRDKNNKLIDANTSYSGLITSQNVIVSTATTSFVATQGKIDIKNLADSNYKYTFNLYSEITMADGTVIRSDVDRYQLLSADDNGSIPENIRYAYKLSSVQASVNSSGYVDADYPFTLNKKQYDKITLPLYATGINNTFSYTVKSATNEINTIKELTFSDNANYRNLTLENYQLINKDRNTITVTGGSTTFTVQINTENIGAALTLPDDYDFYLSSNGKSGATPNWESKGITTTFTGFDWNSSGWDNALKVTNGAQATINYQAFKEPLPSAGRTLSFRFKTTNENFDEVLIKSVGNNTDGFEIYPQKAIMYKGGNAIETQFTSEDSYKEITFVWYTTSYGDLSVIYVNGTSQAILSSSASYQHSQNIIVTADHTTLYLDKVIGYQRALSFNEVQAVYINNVGSDVVDYILENNIFSEQVSIGSNGGKVTPDSLPVGSTYLLIKAFNSDEETNVEKPWELINNLPAVINGEETKSWRIIAGNTYLITKTEDGSGHPDNFYADRIALSAQGTSSMNYPVKNFRIFFKKSITNPVNTSNTLGFGDQFDKEEDGKASRTKVFVQGTEIINTDVKPTAGEKALYKMNSNSIPANVFCLKADFAESSGVHNTGFARMANYAMENTGAIDESLIESIKLPQNAFKSSSDEYDVRSTIDGRPIYLFFESTKGEIVYHGKYNFNNEKASEDVFGFTPYSKTHGYFSHSDVKGAAEELESAFTEHGASFNFENYKKTHFTYELEDGEYINPIECWEFSTNASLDIKHRDLVGPVLSTIGAFTFPYVYEDGKELKDFPYSNNTAFKQAQLNPFTEQVKITNKLAWLNTEQAWEYRFPELEDEVENGVVITKTDSLYTEGITPPYLLRSLYKWVHQHNVYCWSSNDDKMRHGEIFAKDLHLYFNVTFLLKYYVLTKWFINADQRIKNCMISFYCDPKVQSNRGTNGNYPMGKMRAFYIFYDNDTILGVTNTGALGNKWDSKETHEVFQGIDTNDVSFHGIWGNLEYCYKQYCDGNTDAQYSYKLGKLIDKTYSVLRGKLTDATIAMFLDGDLSKFTSDELANVKQYAQGNLPDAADNVDAEVKYFFTSNISPKSDNFASLEKFQGNRKYHREWLLSKRTKWFDAKYGAGSIGNYFISFKLDGASGQMSSGKIKITSAFDEWKFYLKEGDSGTLKYTNLLKLNNEGLLELKQVVNSNVNIIQGLYGASKIDMSEFYGNPINGITSVYDGTKSLELPHLQEFVLGSPNDSQYLYISIGKDNLSGIISTMSNIEKLTLNNLLPVNNSIVQSAFAQLDLTKYTRLSTIDLNKTSINKITCPSGSILTSVKLYNPVDLTMNSNTKVNELIIEDKSLLKHIYLKNCSDLVYKILTKVWVDKTNVNSDEKLTIRFGSDNDVRDQISRETLDNLIQLANRVINSDESIDVTGNAYCPQLTLEDTNTLYEAFGDNLSIVNSDSTDFEFVYDSLDLYENQTLKISSTIKVDEEDGAAKWSIEVDDDTLKNSVRILSSTPYQCILVADPIKDNVSRVGMIKVKAVRDGKVYTSEDINVLYIPISSMKLTTNTPITSSTTTINFNFANQHTKNHLLTSEFMTVVSENGTHTLNLVNDSINSITFNINANTDGLITVTLLDITDSIKIYYDKVIYTKSAIESNQSLLWLNQLLKNKWTQIGSNDLTRSAFVDSAKIPALSAKGGILSCGGITVDLGSVEDTQNLSAVQYFNILGHQFEIPNLRFNNLNIPEGIQEVIWNSTIDGFAEYETITIPSTVNQVDVQLVLNLIPAKLCFDLTQAKSIKAIYNAGSAKNNVFNLSLTSSSATLTASDGILFKYHNGIEQIGQFSDSISAGSVVPASAMFNILDQTYETGASAPLYKLGNFIPSGELKVGCISSYKLSDSAFSWTDEFAAKVTGLYYTFYNNSGNPGTSTTLNFINLKFIGNGTFQNSTCKVIFGDNKITKVGSNAFSEFNSESGELTFIQNKISDLGQAAFALSNVVSYNLQDLVNIGSYCFNNQDRSYTSYTINLKQTVIPTSIGENAFGTNKKHTLNITTDNNNVKTKFLTFKDSVNININGVAQS